MFSWYAESCLTRVKSTKINPKFGYLLDFSYFCKLYFD